MEHNINSNEELEALNRNKTENFAGAIIYTLLVIVFGILGNIVCVMFYGFKVPRTSTNVILTGLATVDLIACILFSDKIIDLCFTVTFKSKPGCKMIHFFNHWLVITSGALLLFVAIDRYLKICRPFRRQLSIKSVKIAFLVIVIAAMVYSVGTISIVDVARVNVTEAESGKVIEAFYCTHSKDPGLKTAINLFHAFDLLAFITIIGGCMVLYVLISRGLWVSRKHIKHANKGWCSNDCNHEVAITSVWYTESSSRRDTPFSCNLSDNIENDTMKSTTQSSWLLSNPDQINLAKVERNDNLCKTSLRDIAVVNDMDKSLTKTAHGEIQPSDTKKQFKHVNFKGNNSPEYERKNKHYSKKRKQYYIERKVTLMMIIITITSIISFVPYYIVNIIEEENSSEQEFSVGIQIALRSYLLNNAINPYIIGLFNSKFRRFVKGTFCKSNLFRT